MRKKYNGYFTVEFAFILPIILFIYLLIIFSAMFLYCRCLISQDEFLLSMRGGRLTWGDENYGEVIYGGEQENFWSAESYVLKRISDRREKYPFYPYEKVQCQINDQIFSIQAFQKGSKKQIVKQVQRINPVKIIQEGRKKDNA